MILTPAWIFSLLGAFAELVGREATAAIRRKQAIEAKKARARKKKARELKRLEREQRAEGRAGRDQRDHVQSDGDRHVHQRVR